MITFDLEQTQAIERGAKQRSRLVQIASKAANPSDTAKFPHTYIFSPAGLGKTHTVNRAIKQTGIPFFEISGNISMFAFGVAMADIVYKAMMNKHTDKIVINVDDCDEILKNETNCNIMKNVLAGSKTYKYEKSMQSQWKNLSEDQQIAIEHFQNPSRMGFAVPTDNLVFIFTSNFKLPTDDEVKEARDKGQTKAVLLGHKNAIRSRCRTQDFDMDKDTQWGWIADVVLNTDAVDDYIETEDEKRILLDWMHNKWDQMTERSIRTVEKMAQSMEEDPTGYKDTWAIDFIK